LRMKQWPCTTSAPCDSQRQATAKASVRGRVESVGVEDGDEVAGGAGQREIDVLCLRRAARHAHGREARILAGNRFQPLFDLRHVARRVVGQDHLQPPWVLHPQERGDGGFDDRCLVGQVGRDDGRCRRVRRGRVGRRILALQGQEALGPDRHCGERQHGDHDVVHQLADVPAVRAKPPVGEEWQRQAEHHRQQILDGQQVPAVEVQPPQGQRPGLADGGGRDHGAAPAHRVQIQVPGRLPARLPRFDQGIGGAGASAQAPKPDGGRKLRRLAAELQAGRRQPGRQRLQAPGGFARGGAWQQQQEVAPAAERDDLIRQRVHAGQYADLLPEAGFGLGTQALTILVEFGQAQRRHEALAGPAPGVQFGAFIGRQRQELRFVRPRHRLALGKGSD